MSEINILLIDDRPDNLLALEAILSDLGHRLVRAESGEEALRQLLKQDFAVILLDVQMPGVDGFETAALIRQREKTQHIPIIFITAINRSEQHLRTGYAVGAVDYLFKPLVPDILKAKVSFFVESYRKTEEIREQARQIEEMNGELEHQLQEVQRLNEQLGSANRRLQQSMRKLQRALERTQAAERAKDTLLSHVTHEMRTPLSSIIGFSNLVLHRQLSPEKIHDFMVTINLEARRLADLVNNFLDLQRLEAGQPTFRFAAVDLAALVRDVINSQHVESELYDVQLELEAVPPVYADADRIRQVVVNLLSNAIKYSPGGGTIQVSLHRDADEVCFSVRDHGLGIGAEEMERLFQRFHRGQAAEYLRVRGTGLGLALCKELIDAHHGRIWAESAGYNQGAIFSFTVPISGEATSHTNRLPNWQPKQVVIVASDLRATWNLAAYLEVEGYITHSLAYDDATPHQLAKYLPDVLIMDIAPDRPDLGWQIMDDLCSYPATQNIPILVCSGDQPPAAFQQNGRPVLHVSKPINESRLVTEVKRLVRLLHAAQRGNTVSVDDGNSTGPGER